MTVLGPFPVSDVMDRLKATVADLRQVGNAADLRTALDQKPRAVPAAFVVVQEQGRPSAGASGGVLVQQVDVSINVVLYLRNYAEAEAGAAVSRDAQALTASVRAALLNWSPSAEFHPLTLQAGRPESYRGGNLVVQEIYRSQYRIEVTP